MLTVLLATHNGAESLPRTLDSFTKLKIPEGGFNVIAVENASTDNTLEVLESFVD